MGWNNWGDPRSMFHDEAKECYTYDLTLGKKGWESFQILLNGEWKKCLHPDRKDGCPYSKYKLVGPNDEGDQKNWTVGRHPLDRGSAGDRYQIRLFLTKMGAWDS